MIFIGLLLVSLSFQRCNHKMDEVYFQDIQPPADYIPFELSLDSAGDTLYLTEPTAIQVNFEANRLEIYKVIVYLDDLIVYDGLNPKPNISLDPERISPDYYTFFCLYFLQIVLQEALQTRWAKKAIDLKDTGLWQSTVVLIYIRNQTLR